ncbi:MAG: right-handed parallel beta-helix repeat-containing protein [Candidatus Eisenbacteria bacterium]
MNQETGPTARSARAGPVCLGGFHRFYCLHPLNRLSVCLTLLALVAGIAYAETWEVPNEIPTVQEALDLAQPGDTVAVWPGGYDLGAQGLTMPRSDVTLLSVYSAKATLVLDDWESTILVHGSRSRIEGFNIVSFMGWAITILEESAEVVIEDNNLEHHGWGGGVWVRGPGAIVRENELRWFYTNPAVQVDAGGVGIESNQFIETVGVNVLAPAAAIHDNLFLHCRAMSDDGISGRGAAIEASSVPGRIEIERNLFADCQTIGWQAEPDAVARGGAIYLESCGDVTILENRFLENRATEGGALYAYECGVRIERNLFAANTDSSAYENYPIRGEGGGLFLHNCYGSVAENTIARNVALVDGGGVAVYGASTPSFSRNIVYANRSEGAGFTCAGQGMIDFDCNDAYGHANGNYGGVCQDPTGLDGNISEDPLFCDPSAYDFTLQRDSPCMPDLSPPGCGLIGAFGIGCPAAGIYEDTSWISGLRIAPNPFQGSASIAFSSTEPGSRIEIRIYDASGRLLRNRPESAFHWDGRDSDGTRLPAGVYFVRVMRDGSEVARRPVVLLR